MPDSIAIDYLTDEQRMQLFHCRPDLRQKCQKCGGNILQNYEEIACLQCGESHDEEGNIINHTRSNINTALGDRLNSKYDKGIRRHRIIRKNW